jgi:histidinol phosphatase-like enzyme (inositol monophosphatase family)
MAPYNAEMAQWHNELQAAIAAARQAGELALRSQPNIQAEVKSDRSPVTQADRECERLIVTALLKSFPDDGVLGEEGASREGGSGRRWIVDPIDGTRDYVRGNPLWANLLALEDHGEIVAGVVNLPGLGLLYSASKGAGAFCNRIPIKPSSKSEISDSVLCFSAFPKMAKLPFKNQFQNWAANFWAVRGLGGAADAMMVCSGQAELWIEPSAAPWDFAALKIIAEESGARYFNFDGGATIHAGNCVICAPAWEQQIKSLLALS